MSIKYNIKVGGTPVTSEYPIKVVLNAPSDFIYWRQKVQDKEVQLAYLESPEILSHEAIFINDYLQEITLYGISSYIPTERFTDTSTIISDSNNLIFTDIVKDTNQGPITFYYGHDLPEGTNSATFLPWNKSTDPNIAIYDSRYNVVCSNLKNELDQTLQVYKPSFVSYTFPGEGGSTKGNHEIFKSELIFKEATYYDIDDETGTYSSNRPIYTVEKLPSGKYEYTFYTNRRIYYKEKSPQVNTFQVRPGLKTNEIWPLEVLGDELVLNLDEGQIKYNWKDLVDNYFPYYPFKTKKEIAYPATKETIKLGEGNISFNPDRNLHLTFKVYRNDKLLLAQTSKPFLIGQRLESSVAQDNLVKYELFEGKVDYSLGLLSLIKTIPLEPTDKCSVEYCYDVGEAKKIIGNANPINNKKLLTHSLYYFCKPKTLTSNSEVYWVEVAKSEIDEHKFFVVGTNLKEAGEPVYIPYMDLSDFFDMYCIYNPFTKILTWNYGLQLLPLGSVSFHKEKYIDNTSLKDIRVYAEPKDTSWFLNRYKGYLFTDLVQPTTFTLPTENHILIQIDTPSIPDAESKDIKQICKEEIPLGLVPHFHFPNRIKVKNLSLEEDTGEDTYLLKVQIKHLDSTNTNQEFLLVLDSMSLNIILSINLGDGSPTIFDGIDEYIFEFPTNLDPTIVKEDIAKFKLALSTDDEIVTDITDTMITIKKEV